MIFRACAVLNRTLVDSDWCFDNMCGSSDVIQLTLALKMTTAQVAETSVTVNNSPIQDYDHADNTNFV